MTFSCFVPDENETFAIVSTMQHQNLAASKRPVPIDRSIDSEKVLLASHEPCLFGVFNHACTQEQIADPPFGKNSFSVWSGLTGWDLVFKLHAIGLDDPGELARLLEEDDPFEVNKRGT